MITRERLEQLIEQGAEIWHLCGRKDIRKTNARDIPTHYRLNNFKNWELYKEYYFETKEDAEFVLEFQNIPRTDTLNLPTWEMFIQLGIPFEFTSKTGEYFYLEICDEEGIDKIVIYNKIGFISNVFSAPVTKENYLEACKIAKKLFLGEERK